MTSVTNNVRALRKARGLTMKELSDRIGKSLGYLQKIETGMRGLKPHEARDLARELRVVPADLLSQADGALTPVERHLINLFRTLPDQVRSAILQTAESFHSTVGDTANDSPENDQD